MTRRKVLFGVDYTDNEYLKLALYLFVGGTAALVEWGLFYLLFYHLLAGCGWSLTLLTNAAASIAFCCSTLYHYFLGNVLVFDSGSRYGRGRELALVFGVSAAGLGWNLLLMYIFVSLCGWEAMPAKIAASCIVVAWNYLARKKWIFRS